MSTEMSHLDAAGHTACPNAKAGVRQLAGAVFWSFFGVRKHKNYQDDFARLTMLQVVIGGLIGGILLVLALVLLVRTITA